MLVQRDLGIGRWVRRRSRRRTLYSAHEQFPTEADPGPMVPWQYKIDGIKAWAHIFGRVLAGYLDGDAATFSAFDVIVPSPTYVGPDGHQWDHIATIIECATEESDRDWPWELESPPRDCADWPGADVQGAEELAGTPLPR